MARSPLLRDVREVRTFASAIAKVGARSRSRSPEPPGAAAKLIYAIGAVGFLRAREIMAEIEANVTRATPTTTSAGPTSRVRRRGPAKNMKEYRERQHQDILKALEAAKWSRVKAAELLGMSRRTFYRRLLELGLTGRHA